MHLTVFTYMYVHIKPLFIYADECMKKITQNQNQLHEQIRYEVNIYFLT